MQQITRPQPSKRGLWSERFQHDDPLTSLEQPVSSPMLPCSLRTDMLRDDPPRVCKRVIECVSPSRCQAPKGKGVIELCCRVYVYARKRWFCGLSLLLWPPRSLIPAQKIKQMTPIDSSTTSRAAAVMRRSRWHFHRGNASGRPRVSVALLLLLSWAAYFGARTVQRCEDWKSEQQLFESALQVCPDGIKTLNNLAVGFLNVKDADRAEELLTRAVEVRAVRGANA